MKAAILQRRAAINELYFIYKHLLRMLPNLVRRSPEVVARVLQDQYFQVELVLQRLMLLALDHGQSPQQRLCAKAADLLDRLFHAERARSARVIPGLRTVRAFKAVRAHLAHACGQLLDALPGDLLPEFHTAAMDMQQHELKQYNDLVELESTLGKHAVVLAR